MSRPFSPHRWPEFRMSRFAGLAVGLGLTVLAAATASAAEPPAAEGAVVVDFDAALRGLKFDPATTDGNGEAGRPTGILDADEMALGAASLNNPGLDLRASGGIDHKTVADAFRQAQASAAKDLAKLSATYPTAVTVAAGYAMLGEASFKAFNTMTTGFGAPLTGDYSLALKLGRYLGPDGDADGDGVPNRAEYAATIGKGRVSYLQAALDPKVKPAPGQAAAAAPARSTRKVIGIVLYPGFEVLDVFGPMEMWANVPDFQVVLIAENAGLVRSAQGAQVSAEYSFETAPALDIVMVPGGIGTRTELLNPKFLGYLREQDKHTEITASVCTGSALLAKAGLLSGHRATSNKKFFSLATDQDAKVDWVKHARWVEDGKFITSSGVSAGTDMALALVARIHGKENARLLARTLEYQWSEDPANDPFAIP